MLLSAYLLTNTGCIIDCGRLSWHREPWLSCCQPDRRQFGWDTVSDRTEWRRHQLCAEHLWRSFSSCLTFGNPTKRPLLADCWLSVSI